MRMVYTKEPLATDKETLFWLNVLEVPPRVGGEEDNQLRFAFRLRTKIFFRPANLAIKPDNAPGLLEWRLVKSGRRPSVASAQSYAVLHLVPKCGAGRGR